MKIIWTLLMLAILCSCFSPQTYANKDKIVQSMADTIAKKFKNAAQITIEDYLSLIKNNEKVVLVDVREKREREISYIPRSITKESFEKNQDNYQNHTVVAYCTIGHRSSQFVESLDQKKFKKAFNLKESILGWTHRKLPLENSQGKTTKVHVYDEPWNLTHDDYEGVFE